MFISVSQLERQMGVHKTIGRFFVDRKPPENNSFWKGRLLYVGLGTGYVFIPIYYDILHRIGLPITELLDERHIRFMEQLMHFATLHEANEISILEELEFVRIMLKGRIQNDKFYDSLNKYFDQLLLRPLGDLGLPYPALNRADVFLYVLCDLPLSAIQRNLAIKYWYALLPNYLIMDDIRDYDQDKENKDQNLILDLGDGTAAFEKAFELMQKNCEIINLINPLLGNYLSDFKEDLRKYVPEKI